MTTTDRPTITPKAATFWLLAAAWTGVILWAGSDSYSAAETSRILMPFVRWLMPDAHPSEHWQLLFALRKVAHVVEYSLLAWLAWAALFSTWRRALLRIVGVALVWVAAVATIDEIRQSYIASRTGSPWDVALDVSGGVLALACAIAYTRFVQRGRRAVESG